jgi:uncharacterized protein
MNKFTLFKTLIIICLLFIAFGIFEKSPRMESDKIKLTDTTTPNPIITPTNVTFQGRVISMNVPAVDNEGNGVATALKVESRPGDGKVLVDVNQLLFWVDTQYSIRTAQRVAQNITGVDVSKVDLIYWIETNASVIEGPSAGAALTVATIAALENKGLNDSVMITGTINPDGTVGLVGAIFAKAKASKDIGAKLFLVPEGQGMQTNYKPVQSCEKIGPVTFCTTDYKTDKVDISKDVGITVKEVTRIEEALKYFLV